MVVVVMVVVYGMESAGFDELLEAIVLCCLFD